jgi:hypothetical protein
MRGEGTRCENGTPAGNSLGVMLPSLSSVDAEGAKSSARGSPNPVPSAPSCTDTPSEKRFPGSAVD